MVLQVTLGSQPSQITMLVLAAERQERQHSALYLAHLSQCARAAPMPGSGRGVYVQGQSEVSAPALPVCGPSLTPAVGGGGGASRAAAEGAGPWAWRRSLGLSVPRPPLLPRFLTCCGPVAANAAARCPPPWHPETPPSVLARHSGKDGRAAET